jgi:response regulator RpfG family c-di-GMP phosphodiesterase
VAERQLIEAGFEVALASNGEEALARLASEHPDLAIFDVIMPDQSGYDLCTYVRSQPSFADLPVLLISGIVDEQVTKQAESCRADGVLKKPLQGPVLKDQVMGLLAKRQSKPSASEPAAQAAPPPAPKVFRITEDQLQLFRQASSRVKEVEALLAQEQARSSELEDRLGRAGARVTELEGLVAARESGPAREREQGSATDLEARLEQERQRTELLVERLAEAERTSAAGAQRIEELSRTIAEIARLVGLHKIEGQESPPSD